MAVQYLLSHTILEHGLPYTPITSMNKQTNFEDHEKILLFLRDPQIVFLAILKNILEQKFNGSIGIKSLGGPIGNNEDRKETQ